MAIPLSPQISEKLEQYEQELRNLELEVSTLKPELDIARSRGELLDEAKQRLNEHKFVFDDVIQVVNDQVANVSQARSDVASSTDKAQNVLRQKHSILQKNPDFVYVQWLELSVQELSVQSQYTRNVMEAMLNALIRISDSIKPLLEDEGYTEPFAYTDIDPRMGKGRGGTDE